MTVPEAIRAHAATDDGAEFLRLIGENEGDRVVSYGELVAEAERWAAFYAARGLGAGQRVIVVLPHSLDLYAAYIGALLGGLVPAMFAFPSPKFSEREYFRNVGTLISTAGSSMLVTYPGAGGQARAARAGRAGIGAARHADHGARRLRQRHSGSRRMPRDPRTPRFSSTRRGQPASRRESPSPTARCSGRSMRMPEAIDAGPADRIVSWLPLYHDMGLIACLFLPLLKRIPLVAMSPFHWVRTPSLWTDAVTEHRATLSWLPNFAYSFLAANVRGEALARTDLSSLRGVVNCSEPIMASSHQAFLERFGDRGASAAQLAVSYAMAENTFAVTSGGFGRPPAMESVDPERFDREHRAQPMPASRAGGRVLVSSGLPLPEHELEILGPDGRALDEREVGEITLRSPCLMSGYDHAADASAEALREGRYHTGDLGYLAGGELFVTGRARDLIIVGGRNIYPQDVERVVEGVEGVLPGRVVAVGVPDPRLGTESLAVLAETRATDPATRERLRQEIHAAVAERTEVVPHVVRVLDHRSLLKSSSGKPARGANRERFLPDTAADGGAAAHRRPAGRRSRRHRAPGRGGGARQRGRRGRRA